MDVFWDNWRDLASYDAKTGQTTFKPHVGDALEMQLVFVATGAIQYRTVGPAEREALALAPSVLQMQPRGTLSYFCGVVKEVETSLRGGETLTSALLDCSVPVLVLEPSTATRLPTLLEPGAVLEGVGPLLAEIGFSGGKLLQTIYARIDGVEDSGARLHRGTPARLNLTLLAESPRQYYKLARLS